MGRSVLCFKGDWNPSFSSSCLWVSDGGFGKAARCSLLEEFIHAGKKPSVFLKQRDDALDSPVHSQASSWYRNYFLTSFAKNPKKRTWQSCPGIVLTAKIMKKALKYFKWFIFKTGTGWWISDAPRFRLLSCSSCLGLGCDQVLLHGSPTEPCNSWGFVFSYQSSRKKNQPFQNLWNEITL